MIRAILKKISHPFLKYLGSTFSSKPRPYSYKGITVTVMPDVFPPHYTFSTKILLDYIDRLHLKGKSLLELGCGSGIISLYAAHKGAKVTASDININAIEALKKNALKNNLELQIIISDLFQNIEKQSFDYVVINPPYYPKTPKNTKEQAWFCGENFEYFRALFAQLLQRDNKTILMILSEDCAIKTIKTIAKQNCLELKCVLSKTVMAEKNFIFEIQQL